MEEEKYKYVDENGLAVLKLLITAMLNEKVDKADGMGLSHNDLTDELKQKILSAGDSSFDGQYSSLIGKPKIGDVELKANNTLEELGIQAKGDYATNTALNELDQKVQDSENVIESIKVNGTAVTPIEKEVSIAVPTKVSDLNNDSKFQTETQVKAIIEGIVANAPEALDTLKEIADALNNDPNFASTIITELGKKINSTDLVPLTNEEIQAIFNS